MIDTLPNNVELLENSSVSMNGQKILIQLFVNLIIIKYYKKDYFLH